MVSKQHAPCEDHAWRRREDRRVGRLLENPKSLEVDPHRVGGVRQASVKKRAGDEQITELVVSHRLRNVQDRKDRGPRAEGQKADHDHRESPPLSKASELSLGETKPVRAN